MAFHWILVVFLGILITACEIIPIWLGSIISYINQWPFFIAHVRNNQQKNTISDMFWSQKWHFFGASIVTSSISWRKKIRRGPSFDYTHLKFNNFAPENRPQRGEAGSLNRFPAIFQGLLCGFALRGGGPLKIFWIFLLFDKIVSGEDSSKKISTKEDPSISIFQRVLIDSKGWCIGTPYHPFSTLWKIPS